MDFTDWLDRQRKFADLDREMEAYYERKFAESLLAIAKQQHDECCAGSIGGLTFPKVSEREPAPLVTWSQIDPEKV